MTIKKENIFNEKKQILSEKELVSKYQYLVTKIARQFKGIPESCENLEEVGYLGLLNAAYLYESKIHQMDFKTYAQVLITEEIHQYLLDHNHQVDCPVWLLELNEKVNNFVIQFRKKYQRTPHISEIASHLNIADSGLQELLKTRDSLRETCFPFYGESQCDISSIKPDLTKIKSQRYQSFKLPIEDLIILRKAFKRIKEIKEGIIYYLFVMDLNQTKLAQMLGMPPEKVKAN